jgi:vacuolar-type H+-ATPase subunit F/Vma7
MKGAVHVIARPGVAEGFALAGLAVTELAADSEAGARIVTIATDDANALVLVEEPLFALVTDTDRAELAKRAVPIVVPFPAPSWEQAAAGPADYILALLQRAIGYRVRLQ